MTSDHKYNNCNSHYVEEEWVDFVMGMLSHDKRQQLEAHLEDCLVCRRYVEEWSLIYASNGVEQHSGEADTFNPIMAVERREQLMPDEKYLLSLQRAVKKQARLKQWKRKLKEHKYMMGGAAAAAFVLVMSMLLFNHQPSTPVHVDQYVRHYEPSAASFVNAVDSARYRIEMAEEQKSSGYLWLKDDLTEVFLWLENLPDLEMKDYQAWAMSGQQASSLGIIQRVGSAGHLYTTTSYLHPTDFIMLTVEPKGGSISPTSKQIVLVVKQQ